MEYNGRVVDQEYGIQWKSGRPSSLHHVNMQANQAVLIYTPLLHYNLQCKKNCKKSLKLKNFKVKVSKRFGFGLIAFM